MDEALARSLATMREALEVASAGLVGRRDACELMALCAVASEHLLLLGPPGTGKSAVARRMSTALGGRLFEYLLGRFTEPSELFGPIDLRRLQEGVLDTVTDGMLPEAEIAFLDEVFLGSTAILNTLLALLNERSFRRGGAAMTVPLRVCVGAANALPTDPTLAAFADRFLVQVWVDPLPDAQLEDLLVEGWGLGEDGAEVASLEDLDRLRVAARRVDLQGVRGALAGCLRQLRAAGVQLSDRRMVRLQGLVAAAAVLDGRSEATPRDLWPVVYAVSGRDAQELAREVLSDALAGSAHGVLVDAAEAAALGPMARAARLCVEAQHLLEEADPDTLRVEAWLREVDAGFTSDDRPPELSEARARVAQRLESLR